MKLKANFSPVDKLKTFYTNGDILGAGDGKYLLCGCSSEINLLEWKKGTVEHSFTNVDDVFITCFILSPDGKIFITANQKSKLRQWDFEEKTVKRTWSSNHDCPIACMDFDSTSTLLCTGSADGSARVWDLDGKCCTNLFRGHSGLVRLVKFNPKNSYELLTSCESYKIKLWNLQTSELIVTFQGHFSAVTSLHFSGDNNFLYSSSRDKVVIVWGLKDHSKRVIPIYECIESMEVLHGSSDAIRLFSSFQNQDEDHLIVAGPSGKISVWNVARGHCVAKNESFYEEAAVDSENVSDGDNGFTQVFMLRSHLVGVTADQTIIFYKPEDLSISYQLVGNNGSILDLKFAGDNHLAMATNTNQLKIFNTNTKSYVLAKGHTDTIMCVDVCEMKGTFYIATGSKDNRVMMWSFDESSSTLKHLSGGEAHLHTVTGVCIAPILNSNNKQVISVLSCSNDKTLKIWNYFPEQQTLSVLMTTEAHDNEINFVTVSPNYEFVATASKDKTAKLWSKSDLRHLGTFKGHKRGVWAAQFSPADKILATASNDLTIMLWDITSFSCLKTFQGHESSVLRVNFLSHGMQLLSCGSDGLMKLWTIKTNECIKTFDAHDDKIWVVATDASGDMVVTGADDGSFTYWKDITEEEQQEAFAKKQEFTLKEQELMNLLHTKQFGQALELAITLNQPKRTLSILRELMKQQVDVSKQLSSLSDSLLDVLLGYSVAWNQNSKTCMVAQLILNHLLKTKHYSDILKFKNVTKVVEGMIPYTERHFSRIKQHLCKASFAECLLQSRGLSANTNFSLPNKCQPEAMVTCANGSDESDMDTN